MTRLKFPQITIENLTSTLTLLILSVQVILLVLLSTRIGRLEKIFANLAGGNVPPPIPVVVERTPDERGQVIGPDNAEVTIVEFSDFECPYCADAVPVIKEILEKYPSQVRFVYRHFPLTDIHSNAFRAAEAAEGAGEQGKFWEMHDKLFANQTALDIENLRQYAAEINLDLALFAVCLESGRARAAIELDLADGEKYGVNSTPTFFVNNMMVIGDSELDDAVENVLSKSNE
ncbi:MAG: DsbA family protein [Anaerolineales bacterium]|nr:DsbA family protein [Anaerolineales bacterium]